eukprot:TRINITY_DN28837_c0_g2_i1.p1 TRINITY_DN28837_c0_g2~~TRINITY_DN28837_c0_g2_i1.p1  ORF type:complete len:120 (+),score=8.15 TRINITY_DN28837_c0_g2_i1:48-407(+)
MHMPEMDGCEATQEIRALMGVHSNDDFPSSFVAHAISPSSPFFQPIGSHARPVIIALTASALKEDQARCKEVGMNGFLTKPVRVQDLISVLKPVSSVETPSVSRDLRFTVTSASEACHV